VTRPTFHQKTKDQPPEEQHRSQDYAHQEGRPKTRKQNAQAENHDNADDIDAEDLTQPAQREENKNNACDARENMHILTYVSILQKSTSMLSAVKPSLFLKRRHLLLFSKIHVLFTW
jgi:hypothetical protein